MRSKRKVSKKYALRLLQRLAIDEEERERLVGEPSDGKGCQSTTVYQDISFDEYKLISQWYHFAILSLARINGFSGDSVEISKRLGISTSCARMAVERLKRLGFLKAPKHSGGSWKVQDIATPDGVPSLILQQSHAKNLELAHESLFRDSLDKRDFTAVTIAIHPKDIQRARKAIRKFRDRLASQLEAGEPKEVYKLCIQLFPISKNPMEAT